MDFVYVDKTNTISDDDIINDVLRVKNDVLKSETIRMRDYFKYGNYGKKAIWNHFGTWNKLLDILGVKKNRIDEHLSKEDIFLLIYDLWIRLDRQPNMREFEAETHHTNKIIISNFGKWSTCLKEFVEWANTNEKRINTAFELKIKHSTPREPSKSLRYDVMSRDGFKCVLCGRSPATTPGLELHIDHIIPYSSGGETVLDNLQTLCSDCNLGKSDKIDK